MILVISPAKAQDFRTPAPFPGFTRPDHLKEAAQLMKLLRPLDLDQLSSLMGISGELAALNAGRFAQWRPPFTPGNAKQAAFAFNGDAYGGLDAASLDPDQLAFAQDHLRILSALYGLLRPLDLIQAYRLDMGTRLDTARGADLCAFWKAALTRALAADLARDGGPLVNAASGEFFRALDPAGLPGRIITPVFEDLQKGAYRVVSFHAKRARGLFCRFAVQARIQAPEDLKGFDAEGYAFHPRESGPDRWVFRR